MTEWRKCRKKPIIVEFREPHGTVKVALSPIKPLKYAMAEMVKTHEGTLFAVEGIDYVIRGVQGELYPIKKDIFAKTYEIVRTKEREQK